LLNNPVARFRCGHVLGEGFGAGASAGFFLCFGTVRPFSEAGP
jgi:hypothetical protein